MAISYQTLTVRGPRRIRVVFAGSALASGAFAPSWFSVTSQDGLTGNPRVRVAMAVQDLPNEIELALDTDLAGGGLYLLAIASGVPAIDLSTAPAASDVFRTGAPRRAPSAGMSSNELDNLVFGIDLVHDGRVMYEGPDGDLATIGGQENAKAAVVRRLASNGIPHDSLYGGKANEFVDAPAPMLQAVRGRLQHQARLDDRVTKVSEIAVVRDNNDGDIFLRGKIDLIGRIPVTIDGRVT